jgi:hypothetical protein
VLDAGSLVRKSGIVHGGDVQSELKEGVEAFLAETPEAEKDWHPNSDRKVLDIIHPSLCPLVSSRTRVLVDGEIVRLENVNEYFGRGSEFTPPTHPCDRMCDQENTQEAESDRSRWNTFCTSQWDRGADEHIAFRYSTRFQWIQAVAPNSVESARFPHPEALLRDHLLG